MQNLSVIFLLSLSLISVSSSALEIKKVPLTDELCTNLSSINYEYEAWKNHVAGYDSLGRLEQREEAKYLLADLTEILSDFENALGLWPSESTIKGNKKLLKDLSSEQIARKGIMYAGPTGHRVVEGRVRDTQRRVELVIEYVNKRSTSCLKK